MMQRSLAVAVAIVVSFAAGASPDPSHAAPARKSASDPSARVVANVGGRPIRVAELDERQRRVERVYKERTGRAIPPGYETFFRRSALAELVHDRLVWLDAVASGVRVSDAEAESLLKADDDFTKNGRFDAAGFARYKAENPIGYKDALRQAREALAALRHGEALERRLEPSADELDRLWHQRYGKVRAQAVFLPALEPGTGPEPTDDEVAAEYARRSADFTWPAQLDYSILSVATPNLPASDRRARIESALADARRGVPFDSLARRMGGHITRQHWDEGEDAAGLREEPDLLPMALAAPAGTVLDRAVESPEGFYLVRIDRTRPRGPAPLARVAGEVRSQLAKARAAAARRAEAKALYDANPKAWWTTAWQVRWALVDSGRVAGREPSEAELTAWYERHPTAFARVDPAGGGIRVPPLVEVKEQAIARWRTEQRAADARRLADATADAWAAGKSARHDPAIETGGPAWIVEGGTRPEGLASDLADSARTWPDAGHVLVRPNPRGFDVVQLVRVDPSYRTPYTVAEPRVLAALEERRAASDSALARAWYDAHRDRYRTGRGYSMTYVPVMFPDPSLVNVPASAIDRYYQERGSELDEPERVKVRHVLVRPGPAGVAQAEARAQSILARLRAGEDFAAVAAAASDDPLTRDRGGDMGWLRRGQAPAPFETAAFALTREQPLSGVVRTEFGWHIIHLDDRQDAHALAPDEARLQIGRLLSAQYADTVARQSAYKLLETSRDAKDLFARAEAARYRPYSATWYEGQPEEGELASPELRAALAHASSGTILPHVVRFGTNAYLLAAVDSVLEPRASEFDEVYARALEDARRARTGASGPTRAERLERDLAAGKAWDAAVDRAGNVSDAFTVAHGPAAVEVPAVPGLEALLFGAGEEAVPDGGWRKVASGDGTWFVHVIERIPPDPSAESKRPLLRAVVLNRRLYDYDEELRTRYPVQVIEPELRDPLPPPPALP